jgi:ABC-2 type transport system permease protein
MLRPMSHRFFAFSQKIGHRALGFFVEFLPVFLLFVLVFRIRLVPARPLWFLISLSLGFIMMFLVNYCVGITGFWLTRAEGLRRIFLLFRDILAGSFIPLVFFPGFLQKLFFFLPFQFISYVPVRVFLGRYELAGITLSIPGITALQALSVLFMLGVSEVLYRCAVRRFTGVGA